MKKIINRNKILISMVALFSATACISVGFASWTFAGGVVTTKSGDIDADEFVIDPVEVQCFSNLVISNYSWSETYGFLTDNQFGYIGTISGQVILNPTAAASAVASLRNSGACKLTIALKIGTYNWSASGAATANITIVQGLANTPSSYTTSENGTVSRDFNVTSVDTSINSVLIKFKTVITASNSNYSGLYTIATNSIGYTLSIGEAE